MCEASALLHLLYLSTLCLCVYIKTIVKEMKSDNNIRKWEVLKSEYLSKEPWFTARKDTVRLPNGNEIPSYYILEYPEWVNVIAITGFFQQFPLCGL